MKKIIILILLLTSVSSFAQQRRDRVKALKVSFITERLDLTEAEAQKFWPIYNASDENSTKIKYGEIGGIRRELNDKKDALTDTKANELLNKLVDAESRLYKENVELINKLRKIISPKKIILLKDAEDDFNRRLFEQFKKWREEDRKRN